MDLLLGRLLVGLGNNGEGGTEEGDTVKVFISVELGRERISKR